MIILFQLIGVAAVHARMVVCVTPLRLATLASALLVCLNPTVLVSPFGMTI